MYWIAHRINTRAELEKLPVEYGVEIDLRDGLDGHIYLEHDPFTPGEDFEEYLAAYRHGLMILNVKSERIEFKALELLKKYNIPDYFFLDSSFPMIKLLTDRGIKNAALRFSEFEGMDTLRNMAGRLAWVWVDCFSKMPLTADSSKELKELGYKICIVSPELQGQGEKIEVYAGQLVNAGARPDAVCAKFYNMPDWQRFFASAPR
jgi:hypothetical protein